MTKQNWNAWMASLASRTTLETYAVLLPAWFAAGRAAATPAKEKGLQTAAGARF